MDSPVRDSPDMPMADALGAPPPLGAPASGLNPSATASPGSRGSRGCGSVVLGVLLVLVGIPMLICPGPGVAVLLAGLGMIGVGLGIKKVGE